MRGRTRWRGGLELEKSRGAEDRVDQMSQALNPLRAMVSLPKYIRSAWLSTGRDQSGYRSLGLSDRG
jgi:hypothetical protein